ncbi:hypothetical protein BKA65DRAFT_557002 [Rhexocercosporidium sp. MPI-PUGE-AT-0058]|nr:hypothetical protein BKA65DRAFT_557002 [Rhexocercosporidium sp. MPI-PUGE-AT-0058]
MALMGERTKIPLPQVFGYEIDDNNPIGVAFMLMELLPGNVAIDADGSYEAHRGQIPLERREGFYISAARVAEQGFSTAVVGSVNAALPIEPARAHLGYSDSDCRDAAHNLATPPPYQETSYQEQSSTLRWRHRISRAFWYHRNPLYNEQSLQVDAQASDTTEPKDDYPKGYSKSAAFIESSSSSGIYRNFRELHVRLLITAQVEIMSLEEELKKLDERNVGQNQGGAAGHDFISAEDLGGEKRSVLLKIRKALLEYNGLISSYQALGKIDKPSERDYNKLFKWFMWKRPPAGDTFDSILPREDLVTLSSRRSLVEECMLRHLDRWPDSCFKQFFQASKQLQQNPNLDTAQESYNDARIKLFARLIVVFFAVLVLFAPVVLFLLTSMSRGCIVVVALVFMIAFATVMGMLTDASDKEIFVGTAAYTAVLVTFLGNLQNADENL